MLQRTKQLLTALVCSAALYAASDGDIVSRSYVAKYLGKVSESEWEKRGSHGEIVTIYSNGVTVCENYLEGRLQGRTTRSYPHSDKIAQIKFFEEGRLLKEVDYFPSGLIKQEVAFNLASPATKVVKTFREDGSMMSVETLQGASLMDGQYFDTKAKFLSSVTKQNGERTFVDENGKLSISEKVAGGSIVSRTNYYPSGSVKSRICLKNNLIDGPAHYFLASGAPSRMESWASGKQNGTTLLFENGEKTAEISYTSGKKNGVEKRFKNETTVAEEISWSEGLRHGPSTMYVNGEGYTQWYFEGKKVNQMTYDVLNVTKLKKTAAQKK